MSTPVALNGSLCHTVSSESTESYIDDIEYNDKNNDILPICEDANLIVNYIPSNMTDANFRLLFIDYGRIEKCKIVRDRKTGASVGYGFVKFSSKIEAERAILGTNGLKIENKTIKVSWARDSNDERMNCKLYVTNVPINYSVEECVSLFSEYGQIIECRIVPSCKGKRCVAFVQFDLRVQAENAVSALNGHILPKYFRQILVKFINKHKNRKNSTGTKQIHDENLMKSSSFDSTYSEHGHHIDKCDNLNSSQTKHEKHDSVARYQEQYYPMPPLEIQPYFSQYSYGYSNSVLNVMSPSGIIMSQYPNYYSPVTVTFTSYPLTPSLPVAPSTMCTAPIYRFDERAGRVKSRDGYQA